MNIICAIHIELNVRSEIPTYIQNCYIHLLQKRNHAWGLLLEQKTNTAIIKSPNNSIISNAMIMAMPRNKLIAPPIFGSKASS